MKVTNEFFQWCYMNIKTFYIEFTYEALTEHNMYDSIQEFSCEENESGYDIISRWFLESGYSLSWLKDYHYLENH